MERKRMVVGATMILSLLAVGCSRSTSYVRQKDGTYRRTTHLVLQSGMPDLAFSCDEDYSVATTFNGITYAWPKGKGSVSKDFDEMTFRGADVRCRAIGRRLSVDGRWFGDFEEGDRVRITGDGTVFVNDLERRPSGDS